MKNKDKTIETTEAREAAVTGEPTLRARLENFFYHYKFWVIAAAFLIFVLVWGIVTGIGKNTQDAYIGYIGDYSYSPKEKNEKTEQISDALDLDIRGNGKSEIAFHSSVYMSEEQIIEKTKEVEMQGDVYKFSPAQNETNYENFISELEYGDVAVWIVSHEVYERMDKQLLLPVADILGYEHEAAVDEYALDCSKLDFGVGLMRENCYGSYLIMRAQRQYSSIMGTEEMNAQDERDRLLFKAIAEYAR